MTPTTIPGNTAPKPAGAVRRFTQFVEALPEAAEGMPTRLRPEDCLELLELAASLQAHATLQGIGLGERRALRLGEGALRAEAETRALRGAAEDHEAHELLRWLDGGRHGEPVADEALRCATCGVATAGWVYAQTGLPGAYCSSWCLAAAVRA